MLAKAPHVGNFYAPRQDTVAGIKRELEDYLYEVTGGTVQSGSFEGMKLLRDTVWEDTYLPPMLLGCYEEELQGVIEQQVARLKGWERAPNVVVVGCAEGYYAVGLARRLPKARVYALDSLDKALEATARAAGENGVTLTIGAPLTEVLAAPDLIVMDCEGAEVAYLDLDKFPALASAHILVEIHNFAEQETGEIILERFRGTHRISLLMEGPRNPFRHKFLCTMMSPYRWLAVCEGRPCQMGWYSMAPKGMNIA